RRPLAPKMPLFLVFGRARKWPQDSSGGPYQKRVKRAKKSAPFGRLFPLVFRSFGHPDLQTKACGRRLEKMEILSPQPARGLLRALWASQAGKAGSQQA